HVMMRVVKVVEGERHRDQHPACKNRSPERAPPAGNHAGTISRQAEYKECGACGNHDVLFAVDRVRDWVGTNSGAELNVPRGFPDSASNAKKLPSMRCTKYPASGCRN